MASSAVATSSEASTPASRKRRLWLPALILAVASAAGAGWFFLQRHRSASSSHPAAAPPMIVQLDSFVVNLADADQETYLRLALALAVAPTEAAAEKSSDASALKRYTPEIRDTILSVITQRRSQELLAPSGKQQLKADLLQALRRRLPELGVQEIYFTDFLVQR